MTTRRSGSNQLPSWFGLPFLLGGIFAFVIGFVLFQDEQRFGREGVAVQGEVIELDYSPGSGDTGPSYEIGYEFVDPLTGVRHAGASDVDEGVFDSTSIGQSIEVTYLPAEPTKSRIGSPEPQLFIPFAVLGMGVIFSVVGIGLLVLVRNIRRNGQPSWLHMAAEADVEPDAPSGGAQDESANPFAIAFGEDVAEDEPKPVKEEPMSEEELRALDARLAPPRDRAD